MLNKLKSLLVFAVVLLPVITGLTICYTEGGFTLPSS